jgi:hypothetical protein
MTHILNPKNSQPLDKNLNLAMPTFGPTTREYYSRRSSPAGSWPKAAEATLGAHAGPGPARLGKTRILYPTKN